MAGTIAFAKELLDERQTEALDTANPNNEHCPPAQDDSDKKKSKPCFAAGTQLLTPNGSTAIEEFRVGDMVLSRSEGNPLGLIEAKPVEEIFRRVAPILHVHPWRTSDSHHGQPPLLRRLQGLDRSR